MLGKIGSLVDSFVTQIFTGQANKFLISSAGTGGVAVISHSVVLTVVSAVASVLVYLFPNLFKANSSTPSQ